MTRPKLRAVSNDLEAIAAESARRGKHLSDDARAYIMTRDWSRCHIDSDRRSPVSISERKGGWLK